MTEKELYMNLEKEISKLAKKSNVSNGEVFQINKFCTELADNEEMKGCFDCYLYLREKKEIEKLKELLHFVKNLNALR
ncbi:hypothetical protein PNO30_00705 [Gemella haemolysans]|uniref:Uncharacterized protein n=1 Tax=Gemella haemolysans TaxID=1379 RepID=A0AAW6B130_9BACL|nr:hypothetical protein [Gemella haemolysans]MDB6185303.1 hypothetical protein [Gemella haemolysans]MDU1527096.1 hypothetical protein [Gemella haemolysans]